MKEQKIRRKKYTRRSPKSMKGMSVEALLLYAPTNTPEKEMENERKQGSSNEHEHKYMK